MHEKQPFSGHSKQRRKIRQALHETGRTGLQDAFIPPRQKRRGSSNRIRRVHFRLKDGVVATLRPDRVQEGGLVFGVEEPPFLALEQRHPKVGPSVHDQDIRHMKMHAACFL